MKERAVESPFRGFRAFRVTETSSTMDEARGLSASSPFGLVSADVQVAGRGRLPGRTWSAVPGSSLLVTLWFPAAEFGDAPLPLLAGLATAEACEAWARDSGLRFAGGISLKWPNDVLCGADAPEATGRKLAGILCERSGDVVYAGIGLNCAQLRFGGEYRTAPTSIALETGSAPAPEDLLPYLTRAFFSLRGLGSEWRGRYEARLAWRGSRVRFSPGIGSETVEGTLVGVDDTGAVLIGGYAAECEGSRGYEAVAYPSGELAPST